MKRFSIILTLVLLLILPGAAFAAPAPESFADLAAKLGPAVVNISSSKTLKAGSVFQGEDGEGTGQDGDNGDDNGGMPMPFEGAPNDHALHDFNELFRMFRSPHMMDRKAMSLGSGFVIDPDGYIVTNNHVVDGAEEITITLEDNSQYVAKVVGTDQKTDLAVLKVDAGKKLPFVQFGDSDASRVGDWVMVIGNPFGLGGTVTAGIISAHSRDINSGPFDDFIQTDAAINRGNSGGPMFNMNGEVIGISTAIFSPNGVGNVGIGFALPSSLARAVIAQLKTGKNVTRGWLGVKIQQVTEEIAESLGMGKARGALVADITPGSPAAEAGVKVGDVIISFDGKEISTMKRLPRIVADTEIGKKVPMVVLRKGKEETLQVMVAKLDETREKGGDISRGKEPEDRAGEQVIGMYLDPLTPELRSQFHIAKSVEGLLVRGVKGDSEAAERGVQRGDVILKVNNTETRKVADLTAAVKDAQAQGRKSILFLMQRGDDTIFLALPLGKEKETADKKPEEKKKNKD